MLEAGTFGEREQCVKGVHLPFLYRPELSRRTCEWHQVQRETSSNWTTLHGRQHEACLRSVCRSVASVTRNVALLWCDGGGANVVSRVLGRLHFVPRLPVLTVWREVGKVGHESCQSVSTTKGRR